MDSGPALQVNAVKVPSNLMLTDLFKVKPSFQAFISTPSVHLILLQLGFVKCFHSAARV